MHFHDLRHTRAIKLVEMGVHPKAMQIRLDHSTSAFTMDKYTHNTPKIQDGISEKLAERRHPNIAGSQKAVKVRGTKTEIKAPRSPRSLDFTVIFLVPRTRHLVKPN